MKEILGIKLYTIEDLAEMFDLHYETVRKLMRDGTFKGQKLAGRWYLSETNLRKYLNADED